MKNVHALRVRELGDRPSGSQNAETIWAIIAQSKEDGAEGIMAYSTAYEGHPFMCPMVTGDYSKVKMFKEIARKMITELPNTQNIKVVVREYSSFVDIEEIQ